MLSVILPMTVLTVCLFYDEHFVMWTSCFVTDQQHHQTERFSSSTQKRLCQCRKVCITSTVCLLTIVYQLPQVTLWLINFSTDWPSLPLSARLSVSVWLSGAKFTHSRIHINHKIIAILSSLLGGHSSPMTEAERDQIDNDAQTVIKTCRETINRLRGEAQKQKVHPQVKEHRAIVIFLIDGYLKGIFFIWSVLDLLVVFICWNTILMYAM